MNTYFGLEKFRCWPAPVALLAFSCLLSSTALAQRPSIASLQARIATLEANNVPGLASYVSVDTSIPTRPMVRVTAANLQVVNGMGTTASTNGVGNLVVGYDEVRNGGSPICSNGAFTDQNTCTTFNAVWAVSHKIGSHNLIIGPEHNYSWFAGLVTGERNTVNHAYASVVGGQQNTASHAYASVLGGQDNKASGDYSVVSGGGSNQATQTWASVSGGAGNTASGDRASVSGGYLNIASGTLSSVSGGLSNSASAFFASASGGEYGTASGLAASVSGGYSPSAAFDNTWAAGTLHSP